MGGEPGFFRNRGLRNREEIPALGRFGSGFSFGGQFPTRPTVDPTGARPGTSPGRIPSQQNVANPLISHQPGVGRPTDIPPRNINPFISHLPQTGRPTNNTPFVNPLISHLPQTGRPVNRTSSFTDRFSASKNFKTSR